MRKMNVKVRECWNKWSCSFYFFFFHIILHYPPSSLLYLSSLSINTTAAVVLSRLTCFSHSRSILFPPFCALHVLYFLSPRFTSPSLPPLLPLLSVSANLLSSHLLFSLQLSPQLMTNLAEGHMPYFRIFLDKLSLRGRRLLFFI